MFRKDSVSGNFDTVFARGFGGVEIGVGLLDSDLDSGFDAIAQPDFACADADGHGRIATPRHGGADFSATARSTVSPAACPWVSLTRLKSSTSIMRNPTG